MRRAPKAGTSKNRVRRHWRWMALGGLSGMLVGCPGRLQDPERFLLTCPPGFDVERDIFQTTCGGSGCHQSVSPAGGLDLASPGVAGRLIRKPASTCPGHLLIATPDSGFLFDKVELTEACGAPMPLGKPALTQNEIFCITQWAAAHADGGG